MQIRLNRKFKTLKVKLLEPRFCADNYKYNNAIQIQKVLYFHFIENSYSVRSIFLSFVDYFYL